jgi:hypothetical protein
MSDPVRFREPGSAASEELRRLFQVGTEHLPTDAELSNLAARLGPVLEPPPPQSPSTLVTAGKVAAVSAVVVGVAVLFALDLSPRGRPPHVSTTSSSSTEGVVPSAPPSVPAATTLPSGDAAPAVPSNEPAAPASGHSNGVNTRPTESEAELLERARNALTSSPARALALTEQHRARFPSGVLTQEREVIAIEALKRLGRTDEAARRAADFARRYPGSAYRKKLDTGRP